MSIIYKRILNEYQMLNNLIHNNPENYEFKNFIYKIITIDSENILFKSEININYNNTDYNIKIFYDRYYPFNAPCKLLINNINIFEYYKEIIEKNKDIINKCLHNESILCNHKWVIYYNLENIVREVLKIIDYKQLYIKRQLLNLITEKYTNQNLDYLHSYLL